MIFPNGLSLGEYLRHCRESKGMSRAKLCEFARVNPNSMVTYEKAGQPGGKYPNSKALARLCDVLDIDPRIALDFILEEDFAEAQSAYLDEHPSADVLELHENVPQRFFQERFATDIDWMTWKHSIKSIEDLNSNMTSMYSELHYLRSALEKAKLVPASRSHAKMENGPDQVGPSRSKTHTTDEKAVDAASTKPKKERPDEADC